MNTPERVLVTGAAGAIGSAIARAMRAAWPACELALLDRDADAMRVLAEELGRATTHGYDLRDVDGLPAFVASLRGDRPFDGLVNCAGVMIVQHVHTWDWQTASDLLAIDLIAPLRLQDLLVRDMVDRRSGVIVNVASMAGKVALKGCTYYGAAKAGLSHASEVARADLAPHGVRVVTVYPGPVKSPVEQAGRDGWGGGGLAGKLAPVGKASELAKLIMRAIDSDEPRVIYPKLYSFGWSATNVSRWIALSYGPDPVS